MVIVQGIRAMRLSGIYSGSALGVLDALVEMMLLDTSRAQRSVAFIDLSLD